MLQSAKTFTYIWSIGWSYDMFNLVGHHFPYFMAILLPFYGFFWPKMAIFGHRQSQQPQIGWTLGEQGWTLFFTSGGISLGLLDHTEMSLGGPRTAQNGLLWAKKAIVGHRQSQRPQIPWRMMMLYISRHCSTLCNSCYIYWTWFWWDIDSVDTLQLKTEMKMYFSKRVYVVISRFFVILSLSGHSAALWRVELHLEVKE